MSNTFKGVQTELLGVTWVLGVDQAWLTTAPW